MRLMQFRSFLFLNNAIYKTDATIDEVKLCKVVQGVLDYRDDHVQKKFPDNWNPNNRGYILYYSAQNDQKFPVIVRNV